VAYCPPRAAVSVSPGGEGVRASSESLGSTLAGLDRYDEAIEYLERGLAGYRARLGEQHPVTLNSLGLLADAHRIGGRFALAESLFAHVVDGFRRAGSNHVDDLLRHVNNRAIVQFQLGNMAGAAASFRDAYELFCSRMPAEHTDAMVILRNQGVAFRELGRYEEAEVALGRALAFRRARGDEADFAITSDLMHLGLVYRYTQRPEAAERLLREAVVRREQLAGAEHSKTAEALEALGGLLRGRPFDGGGQRAHTGAVDVSHGDRRSIAGHGGCPRGARAVAPPARSSRGGRPPARRGGFDSAAIASAGA
jgi:tetratricopeptide (TPR) repeat protein